MENLDKYFEAIDKYRNSYDSVAVEVYNGFLEDRGSIWLHSAEFSESPGRFEIYCDLKPSNSAKEHPAILIFEAVSEVRILTSEESAHPSTSCFDELILKDGVLKAIGKEGLLLSRKYQLCTYDSVFMVDCRGFRVEAWDVDAV